MRSKLLRITLISFCVLLLAPSVYSRSTRPSALGQQKTKAIGMIEAAKAGDTVKVKELISANPSIVNEKNDAGETPILAALFRGHKDVVDLLVSSGTHLNLFEASCLGKVERVRELLEQRPELINHKGFGQASALHFAAFLGHRKVVELLLERKAEVNAIAEGIDSVTPLASAIANKHLEIAELLLSKGSNVNAKQSGGFTPLHEAAQSGQKEMTELLIRSGADVNAKNDKGQTPLGLALEKDYREVAELLRKRGGRM